MKQPSIKEIRKALPKQLIHDLEVQAEQNIRDQGQKMLQSLNQEEKDQLLINSLVELHKMIELNKLMRNAFWAAQAENIPFFDPAIEEELSQAPNSLDQKLREALGTATQEGIISPEVEAELLERVDRYSHKNPMEQVSSQEGKQKRSSKVRLPELVSQSFDYPLQGEKCPVCGKELIHMGWNTRLKLVYTPGTLTLVEERYEKGKCPNGCEQFEKPVIVEVEPSEPSLIEKSYATESLVAGLACEKFLMGVPLYRLEKSFQRSSIPLSRQSMSHIMEAVYDRYLAPLCRQVYSDFSKSPLVHLDETSIQCLELRDERTISWMLVGTTGENVEKSMTIYQFSEGRTKDIVAQMVTDHFEGVMMSDGLSAYESYESTGLIQPIKLTCMAHARRYFYKALTIRPDYKQLLNIMKNNKSEGQKTKEIVETLGENEALSFLLETMNTFSDLYKVEAVIHSQSRELKGFVRDRVSKQLFGSLTETIREMKGKFGEETALGKAINYFLKRVDKLEGYLEDGDWPIDNNICERAVKRFVISRKNFLFANTQKGAESAAGYMTLLASAEDNHLDPFKYLEYVLHQLKICPEINEEILKELTPYSKTLPAELYVKK